VRTLIRNDFKKAFEKVDVIASPVSPTPAFKIGEKLSDPLSMYLADIYTISANLAGICGVSVPCGTVASDGKELPVGLQLLGKPLDETTILKTAFAV
jgi:aspartyl-tRNA(Asn)/glutamyl-tRNA(Gln) amidotransferase subunit A